MPRKVSKSAKHAALSTIERTTPYVKVLINSAPKVDKMKLLKRMPPHVVNDIIEILYNVIRGNIKVNDKDFKVLRKFKKPLMRLVNIPVKNKRKQFVYKQKGGFIGALLPIVASLVGGLAANAL